MLQYDLTAQVRNKFGKGGARSLRRDGLTPAILYGSQKKDPVALQLNTKDFTQILLKMQRRNAVFNLAVDAQKHHVMVKELQTNPINDTLVHADFYEVLLDKPMELEVPVVYSGKAAGVELGGDLHVHMSSVTLRGLVLDIPDYIQVDVSPLGIGDKLTCGDLDIPAGIELLADKDHTCVSVAHASKAAPAEEEEEGEAAEAPAAGGDAEGGAAEE